MGKYKGGAIKHWIEYLRTLAILAVIVIHVTAPVYKSFENIDATEWWFSNLLNSASRFCVPMFVMISGCLLLGRKTETIDFYQKRAFRLIPAFLFWSLFYLAFSYITDPDVREVGLTSFTLGAMVTGKTYYHLWYLSMFICLMLFVPFINKVVTDDKLEKTEALILFILFIIFMSLQQVSIYGNEVLDKNLSWFKIFPWFITYFLMGYIINKYKDSISLSTNTLLFILIISVIMGMVQNYIFAEYFNIIKDHVVLQNNGIFVFIITCCLFTFFMKMKDTLKENKLINSIAAGSFGMYLIHPAILWVFQTLFEDYFSNQILMVLVAITFVFTLSYVSILLLRNFKAFRYIS